MKATWLYRTAAIIFVLFALGHTFGFLKFRPHSPEGLAVFNSMNDVHFAEQGATFSYGNFYKGFGLSISVNMLLSAFVAWHLGQLAKKQPNAVGALGWAFAAVQLAGVILSWLYIAVVPALFSLAVLICLALAAAFVSFGDRGNSAAVVHPPSH